MNAGELTSAMVRRALDGLWAAGFTSARALPPGAGYCPEPARPMCPAVLFPLPPRPPVPSEPVHPAYIAYFDPSQGPAPLWCELEEHPAGTWHREGRTWWK